MNCSLIDTIGNTPIVRVSLPGTPAIFAKLEYRNPSGSIKDRTAMYMVEQAEAMGQLKPGGTIVESSSGNQGIALAMIGAAKGYRVIITVSEKVSDEKLSTLKAYGAQVIVCPVTSTVEDPRGYYQKAKQIARATAGAVMLDQFFNRKNPEAHYHGLGPEIWEQTNGRVTHFFAAAGTGGTVSGAGKFLKEQNPAIKIIAVDAATSFNATHGHPKPYKLEGVGIDFDTPCLDRTVIDDIVPVSDEDGIAMLKILSRKYGLLVGPSSGAVAYAAKQYCRNNNLVDGVIIMIFGDSGRAYLSKGYYD
ncbi:MAG: cysteine synthase family protein [Candidatus Yonathbacteria bacterium]|nr:cysteine synthase family protein [Candidatus Yonathbacteria bacterium]